MSHDSTVQKTTVETIKFGLVGLSGVGVNLVTVWLASSVLRWSDEVSLALGIAVSLTTNYVLNRTWTFQSERDKRTEYPKYVLSNMVGIALQYLIAIGLENWFEAVQYQGIDLRIITVPSLYLASLTGIGVGFVANFVFAKYFVFTA